MTGDLPKLFEALLDDADVLAYESDLEAMAVCLEVRLKASRQSHGTATADLHGAMTDLRAGRATGVQFRYLHRREAFLDTLLREGVAYRLFRMPVSNETPTDHEP